VQWCHGAPGFIPVLTKAYQLLDESSPDSAAAKQQILAAAKKAADVVWERGLLTKVNGWMMRLSVLWFAGSWLSAQHDLRRTFASSPLVTVQDQSKQRGVERIPEQNVAFQFMPSTCHSM